MVKLGLFFLLFVRGAWIEVPANSDGLPVNAFVKTTKSRLHFKWQEENCCPRTSRTDFSSKTLWDIFLGHPVVVT